MDRPLLRNLPRRILPRMGYRRRLLMISPSQQFPFSLWEGYLTLKSQFVYDENYKGLSRKERTFLLNSLFSSLQRSLMSLSKNFSIYEYCDECGSFGEFECDITESSIVSLECWFCKSPFEILVAYPSGKSRPVSSKVSNPDRYK